MQRACLEDIPNLVKMMEMFYAESNFRLDTAAAAAAFRNLLDNESWGDVWRIDDNHQTAGYAVTTYRFAMEFGGSIACIDDLYVMPTFRNRGLGRMAVHEIREHCTRNGFRGLCVEVDRDNQAAMNIYRAIGLVPQAGRRMLALPLSKALHQGEFNSPPAAN
ncbi:Acetyltransferase (GNAT) family protein [Rosistilla carotiformis]|uniref:Acetyltransferase (GNAT) family protein n=1 Tax=Rosistilla carotiformis TaxID=2528017 RepID=A0A518JUZ5_9BACT|nr:GNAT family N-acetyltransferase [Rosistilla carotiformis]QDV69370.1 Acetyltransferase (GNAT) family protein [Rosistilla carotiformis]